MSGKLKPCPFCGGAARTQSNRDWHRIWADHADDCVLDNESADLMYPAQPGYLIHIAEQWNRRVAPPQSPTVDVLTKLAVGVLSTTEGAYVTIHQTDESGVFVIYLERHPIGQTMGVAHIALPGALHGNDMPAAPAAPASIDTPMFRLMLADYRNTTALREQHRLMGGLIAHIAAWGAQLAHEGRRVGRNHQRELEEKLRERADRAEASLARIVDGVRRIVRWDRSDDGMASGPGPNDGRFIEFADVLALLPAKADEFTRCSGCDAITHSDNPEKQCPSCADATPAPAMGEELPKLPKHIGMIDIYGDDGSVKSVEGWTADQVRGFAIDYGNRLGRACIAERQAAAPETDITLTDIPQGDARGSTLDQLYAAWHREPCGDTLHAIGCAIQELQARIDPAMELRIAQLANEHLTSSDYNWQGDFGQIMAFAGAVATVTAPVKGAQSYDPRVDDMAMLIRCLVHALRTAAPAHALVVQAMDYLHRKGLQGSPLRQDAAGASAHEPRTADYDVTCDRRDLFDFLRAAWREGQHAGGEMDTAESWNRATDHATKAIQGWASLLPLERKPDALRILLDQFLRAAYTVSSEIDARGYRWSEAYLDQARAAAFEQKGGA